MDKVICILGMHRSGTSLIANAIHSMGVYFGEESTLLNARSDNPEGFWELAEVVTLQEELLADLKTYWSNPAPLPENWWLHPHLAPYKSRLKEIIVKNFNNSPIWAWKDPRTCLLLPMWQQILGEMDVEIQYLIVFRNPIDVAKSLGKRDNFPYTQSIGLWLLYNLHALHYTIGCNRFFVQYDAFITSWEETIPALVSWLGLNGTEQVLFRNKLSEIIKPSLQRNKTDITQYIDKIPKHVFNLYEMLQNAASNIEISNSVEFKEKIEHEFNQFMMLSSMFCEESYLRMQLYWLDSEGIYTEKCSDYVTIKADFEDREYEIMLPPCIKGTLRLDPTNNPARCDVEFIKIYEKSDECWKLIAEISEKNNFKGIIKTANINIIENKKDFCFLSINDDPQLYLDLLPLDNYHSQLKLTVKIRCEPISDSITDSIIRCLNAHSENSRDYFTHAINHLKQEMESKIDGFYQNVFKEINKTHEEYHQINSYFVEISKQMLLELTEMQKQNQKYFLEFYETQEKLFDESKLKQYEIEQQIQTIQNLLENKQSFLKVIVKKWIKRQ
ncbi:hypothetical protein SD70_24640 [Gordoniibacillus kamchatkensis]|uniref:Sulfotransferase family protein n=1 Tax=Gordoniibacillus kamchatkensis TaxID=1590651 RepID=A0ABR5ACM8_9BACL|nr:sulfotransferase family protein [Paenibacillus sp. VKM B-2647]KIL38720.1 hypothetical protein SD70_24640 [Paenibacillus sp. VKM B-2647]